jgi:hypothetical protein
MGKAASRYQCPENELIKHTGWSEVPRSYHLLLPKARSLTAII